MSDQAAMNEIPIPFMHFIKTQFPNIIPALEKEYGITIDFSFFDQEFCIFGSAQSCVEKINTLASETGINNFTFIFSLTTLDHQQCIHSMERFARSAFSNLKNKSHKIYGS